MTRRPSGKLRIIGGEFRSRIVEFDPGTKVRPTPDRVRQTLFDWLAPLIAGASCLDLFAGSGALGFEALSRGAAHVTFVDSGARQAAAIRAALQKLGAAGRAEVRNEDALAFLRSAPPPAFDVVFLDPPFDAGLLGPALAALPGVLAADARVYAEWHRAGPLPWPPGYAPVRGKKAGQVSYALATFNRATA
ncbi:MAG: 16S rRNA (guanine(966)-N(2))-methyltransferase RsmD [Gammaproteobacteria bacterium]